MPTVLSLYKQRRRWQRGALENLLSHGINLHTLPYLLRQMLTYLGVVFLPFYMYTLAVALLQQSDLNFFQPLWLLVAVVYLFEQSFSVRKGGWRAVLVSIAVLPELLLNMFLDVIYVVSFFGVLFATDESWGRMRHLNSNEFDKQGRPITAVATSNTANLYGTHRSRQTLRARFDETMLSMLVLGVVMFAVLLPLVDLQAAWNAIAVYVLLGFGATLLRLVPVPTF
jgi:hypothetical protein